VVLLVADAAPDYTLWGMLLKADPVVRIVMLGLALASVGCWAIILEKLVRLSWLRAQVRKLEAVAKGAAPDEARRGLVRTVLTAAQNEAEDGASRGEDRSAVRARLDRAMRGAMKSELQRQESGLPFLATIGSSAPFIGLFGTVWGIMNSFIGIATTQTTNLAVVAPGIAEALFATAFGLFAAVPAVVFYNMFARRIGAYQTRMDNFASEVLVRVQREYEA
jgi:tonB-system energizer ExbB